MPQNQNGSSLRQPYTPQSRQQSAQQGQYGQNPYAGQQQAQQAQPGQGQVRQRRPSQADNTPVYSKAQVLAWQQNQMAMLQNAMDEAQANARSKGHRVAALTAVIGLVLGVLVALLLSRFVFGGGTATELTVVSGTLSESGLSQVVGTYAYDGTTYEITAREAILGTQSLSASQNADGTYDTPSSDMILSYARNQILAKAASDAGITASADEVSTYMQNLLGTTDISTAAAYLNMDTDQAQSAIEAACAVSKLKDSVTAGATSTASISEPTWPEDGDVDLGHAEYADYIINLLGSNWDATTGTWANTDNPYYEALKDQVFGVGSASYNAASLAYGVAVQQAQSSDTDAASVWTDYVNQYLDKAAITINTLRA